MPGPDMALSPGGARLAVEISPNGILGTPELGVFDLSTGALRTWSPPGIGTSRAVGATQGSLSWTSDGRTLALIYWGRPNGGILLLRATAPGTSLLANGRLAVGQPKNAAGEAYWIQARVSPDGRTVIAIRDRLRRKVSQQLVAFSTATGKVRQVLSDVTFLDADDEQVQWMTPSGSKLIVTDTRPAHAAHTPFYEANAGVLSGGHYAPLPWSTRTFAAAW